MKILFFAPHAAIWIHAFPEALIAEAATQHGHEIMYVSCGGLLRSHCVSMSGYGVPFEASDSAKEGVCRSCRQNEAVLRKRFGFLGPDLVDVADGDDLSLASRIASGVTQENYLDLRVDNLEVGKIALYELALQSKKSTLTFSPGEWQRYLASVKNVIVVLRAAQRMLAEFRPDRVVVYNALYSVNRVVCRLAQLNDIPQYFLHAGDNLSKRLSTLILSRNDAFSYCMYLREKWTEVRDRPCPAPAMESATNHFLEVVKGRSLWAYSTSPNRGVDLKGVFGIAPDQKVISATLSSDDERSSGEIIGVVHPTPNLIYPKQLDWVKALIAYVDGRPDLSLIVRVHPREFPNKRDGMLSEHASMLKAALASLPVNVRVNWPTDNISLYDLANITDVFTNSWSNAGKEMALLGLPVVLYSRELVFYPADLNYAGTTEAEYFSNLEQALRDGWSPERIRKVYRWCAMEYGYAALDISESFSRSEYRSIIVRAWSRLLRSVRSSSEQEADCRDRAARLRSSQRINAVLSNQLSTSVDLDVFDVTVSEAEEAQHLKREVRRLVAGLYGETGEPRPRSLEHKLRTFCDS